MRLSEYIDLYAGYILIVIGLSLLILGYWSLTSKLPKLAKDTKTEISIVTLKACLYLVIGGLVIIILGALHLIGVIPWWP